MKTNIPDPPVPGLTWGIPVYQTLGLGNLNE